jgi:hypothetical protein
MYTTLFLIKLIYFLERGKKYSRDDLTPWVHLGESFYCSFGTILKTTSGLLGTLSHIMTLKPHMFHVIRAVI